MTLRSPAKAALMLWAVSAIQPAAADTLELRDRLVFGKLIAIQSDGVRFAPACGAEQIFEVSDIKQIERNGSCKPKPIRPYSAGGALCASAPLALVELRLRSPKQVLLVSEASLANGRLHVRSADGLMAYHGPATRFAAMAKGLHCREGLAPTPKIAGFCVENVPWAVNFGPEPVFDNRILTRGLSFYLEDDFAMPIAPDDPRSIQVRDAFGNALAQWMGALQDLGSELPAPAHVVVESMISRSANGYTLMTPPQVVRVGCRDSASFVVRYVGRSAVPMTVNGHVKAARAQVEGRTMWINGVTYPCWRAALTGELYFAKTAMDEAQCLNLTPILVHELGHAFGLAGHRDDPAAPSIMDSVVQPAVTRPTKTDAQALTAILLAAVTGAPPGRLDDDGPGVEVAPLAR